jgi:hypothetical protein
VQGGYGTCFCNPGTKFNRSRYRVKLLLNVIASRNEFCKNRDKLITPTVRVIVSKVKRTRSVMVYKTRFAKRWASLQMVLIVRFCKFSRSKTVNCHMQARDWGKPVSGAQSFNLNKNHRPSLNRTSKVSNKFNIMIFGCLINNNGPAVEGVSVTRRSIRAGSSYPALAGPERCHGARRVWHVFLQSGYKV